MFIYNVTTKVDWSIHKEWLHWMKEEHLQEVVDTGCFIKSNLLRLHETDETEGPTYAAQFIAPTKFHYEQYIQNFSQSLRQKSLLKWGNKIISFRSLMEIVN
jgi:hypothetical protein